MNKLKLLLCTCIAICGIASAYADVDAKAREVLDKTSSLYKGKGGMQIEMDIFFNDEKTDASQSAKGTLLTYDRKFLLDTKFASMLFDGEFTYVYVNDADELTITRPEEKEVSGMDPTALLEMYKSDYKVTAPESISEKGQNYYSINLYPEDLDSSEFSKLNIKVSQSDYSIYSVSTYSKNGITNTIRIRKISTGMVFDEATFTFDKNKFPTAVVIDLR